MLLVETPLVCFHIIVAPYSFLVMVLASFILTPPPPTSLLVVAIRILVTLLVMPVTLLVTPATALMLVTAPVVDTLQETQDTVADLTLLEPTTVNSLHLHDFPTPHLPLR